MKDAKIFIGGEQVDLFDRDKLRLALTYSIADINKIETRSSGFSKTVTVPRSHNNDLIFGFGTDINSSDAYSQNERRAAYIEVGGTVLLRGVAKTNKNTVKNADNTGQYEFVIIGDNADWKEQLSENNINELDYSDQDHVLNKANIDTSETVSTTRDYVYPLINYGMPVGGHPVTGNFDIHDITVEDRYPAFNIKSMFDKMFLNIGYKVESDFMNTDFFKRLYLPFTNQLFKHPSSFKDDNLFKVGLSGDQVIVDFYGVWNWTPDLDNETGIFFDTGDDFDDSNIHLGTPKFGYTVFENSIQKFTGQLHYNSTVDGTIRLFIFKNGSLVKVTGFQDMVANESGTIKIQTDFIKVLKNDRIELEYEINSGSQFILGTMTFKELNSYFSNDISLQILEDTDVGLNDNLPDINQLDFVKGIKDLFNLYFLSDTEARTVFIEPRDDFYKTRAIDWTDKLDKSRDEEITHLNDKLKKIITYQYVSDSGDGWTKQLEKERDVILASNEITNANKFVKGEQKAGTNIFASTIMRPFDYIGLVASKVPTLNTDAIIPRDISEKSTNFRTRILYYDGVRSTDTGESWFFEGIERTNYPYFYSVDVTKDNDNSLYYDNTRRSRGLFNKYYENLHDTLDNGRLYAAFFNLNDSDIANIDFRIPIFVKNTYYLLNKIVNYDPLLNVTTKVELIRATSMNIQAIALEAEGGEGIIFTTPSIPIGQDPIKEDEDPTTPPDKNEATKKSLTISSGQDDTGVVVKGVGNHSAHPDVVMLGEGLEAEKDGQVVIGRYNEEDENAQMVLGGGDAAERKTLAKVAEDGTLKPSNGSRMVMTIDNVSVDMVYTDPKGETQMVVKTDNVNSAAG